MYNGVQVTIWLGVFPIVVSWWAALGLTIYFIATNAVLYYVKSIKHIEALWFANCANQLLFWTYIKVSCLRLVRAFAEALLHPHMRGQTLVCHLDCISWQQRMKIKQLFASASVFEKLVSDSISKSK